MSKIDLIIDALLVAQSSVWSALNEDALSFARELKNELAEPRIPAKIIGPNLEQILNAAGFYKREWVGLTNEERNEMIGKIQHDRFTRQRDLIGSTQIITEMYLKDKNT